MKKILTLILAILMLATMLIGCNVQSDEPDIPNDNIQTNPPIDDDEYDDVIVGGNPGETDPPVDNPPVDNPPIDNPPVDNPPVDNPPTTEAPESSQVASGFVAKQKKYDYGENNIIILNVTNQNNDNYIVTITGYYLDSTGNVLKSETQTVQGYVAEYEKYFLFNPEIAFDNFIFTLKAEKYDGECIDHLFKLENLWLEDKILTPPVGEALRRLILRGDIEYSASTNYRMNTFFVIIDNTGNVYCIEHRNFGNLLGLSIDNTTIANIIAGLASEANLIPETLKNNVTIIAAYHVGELFE